MSILRRGGKREGAGRKVGSNRFGEQTERLRVPHSIAPTINRMLDDIAQLRACRSSDIEIIHFAEELSNSKIPLVSSSVPAGFPSPADDYIEGQLDLNEHFIRNPSSTFCVRVTGESMKDAGILPQDILIVDRSLDWKDGSIVIAVVDGELTVKRLFQQRGHVALVPENPDYPRIEISGETELTIWGVVSGVTRKL